MRRRSAVLALVLLVGLAGCCQKPAVTTAGSLGSLADPPTKGEIDIIFHGLVSFVFQKDGSVESVFLSPQMLEHIPLFAVDTTYTDKSNMSKPDFMVTGSGDTALAVWKFTEASVDPHAFDDKTLDVKVDALNLNAPDYNLIRWVPSMDDIFGSPQAVNSSEIAKAPATGLWTVGKMTPIFDRDEHKTESWTIGKRFSTPVADGVRIRLELHDPGLPLTVTLKRGGTDEHVVIKGGATVFFSNYPTETPKPNQDMAHFVHFYTLRADQQTPGPIPTRVTPPTPYPSRCAPGLYYPPVN